MFPLILEPFEKNSKKFKDITTDNNGHKIQLSLQIHFNVCSLDEFSMNVNKDFFSRNQYHVVFDIYGKSNDMLVLMSNQY